MGNRSVKKLCIAMIYLIPVIIFIGTLSKMYKVFWNVNACMSDYYLAVYDWKTPEGDQGYMDHNGTFHCATAVAYCAEKIARMIVEGKLKKN